MREIRFDIYFSLLLSILFIPSTFSYRTLHGCLTKPNMIAFGKDIGGPNGGSIEVDSLESCALACSKESACHTFFFKASTSICQLRQGTELLPRIGYTGGWCPRGVAFHPDVGTLTASVPLQCSSGSGKICQFPVKVGGQVHWNCIDRSGTPVCNTREASAVQSFSDLSTFEECGTCDQCGSNTIYEGFLLAEKEKSTAIFKDVTSKEECRILCHLAEGCSFFNFVPHFQECSLKYGVGKPKENGKKKVVERIVPGAHSGSQNKETGAYFGPTFCPDDCDEPKMIAERNFGATLTCSVSCRLNDKDVIIPAASVGKVCGEDDGSRFDEAPPSTTEVEPKIVNNQPSSSANPIQQAKSPNSSSGQRQNAFTVSALVFVSTIIAANVVL